MKIILFIAILVEIVLFRIFSASNCYSFLDWILIAGNIICIGSFLLAGRKDYEKKYNLIIFFSFIIRNIVLYLDIQGLAIGFTGDDTERFYLSAIGQSSFTHNYSDLLKIFVNIIGDSRIVLQYINVLASLLSMIYLKKILSTINKDKKRNLICLGIFAFGPANILLSCSLLRESIMIFLNIVSIYNFIIWYKNGKKFNFILSCLLVFISSWLHSGMLALIIGYAIAYTIYNPKIKKICFTKKLYSRYYPYLYFSHCYWLYSEVRLCHILINLGA